MNSTDNIDEKKENNTMNERFKKIKILNMDLKKKNVNNIFQIYYLKHFAYKLKINMSSKMYTML